jgi:two-component system, sensor histidine kinase PdtaS
MFDASENLMPAEPGNPITVGAYLVGSVLLFQALRANAEPDITLPPEHAARNSATACYDSARTTVNTDPTTSLRCALRGLTLAQSINDPRLQALGCQLAGEAHFQIGANDSSETYHLRALDFARSADDDSLKAAALNNAGLMAYMRGDPTVALQQGFEALTIARRAGLPVLEVRIYNHLGLAARDFGTSVTDSGFFQRALREAAALGDSEGIAITRNHLGSWMVSRGIPDSALSQYEASLRYHTRTGPGSNNIAVLLNNIANVYRIQRRYQEADASYRKSLAITTHTGSKNLIATTYKNLAILARERGDHRRALAYARKAQAISLANGLSRIAILSAQEIPLNLAALGHYRTAYDSLVSFLRLRDSLDNERNVRHIAELQVRFDSERKEQIIQQLALERATSVRNYLFALAAMSLLLGLLLYFRYREKSSAARELAVRQGELEHLNATLLARNDQLQISENHLRDSLREKEVLLKEIHHRVKNNLQVVSSLLNLQSNSITDKESQGLLLQSQNRIRAMALIHERLYRSGTFVGIDLAEYLADLVEQLRNSHGSDRVIIGVSSDPVSVNLDTAIPLGLIVNELVTNAFKHAFPGHSDGTIQVIARSLPGNECVLTVADDGNGQVSAPDGSSESTLGLHLVQILVEQIDGHLQITSDAGTRFDVSFPLYKHESQNLTS